jgi:hypothetical protein
MIVDAILDSVLGGQQAANVAPQPAGDPVKLLKTRMAAYNECLRIVKQTPSGPEKLLIRQRELCLPILGSALR